MRIISHASYQAASVPAFDAASSVEWLDFGKYLRDSDLGFFLSHYTASQLNGEFPAFDSRFMPEAVKELFSFFILGEPREIQPLKRCMPEAFLQLMQHSGVLLENGGKIRLNGLRLVYHLGAMLFVESLGPMPSFYFGNDSQALGKLVAGIKGRVLDVCCGVGPQTVLAALSADEVWGVEINPAVKDLFFINLCLNGRYDRGHLYLGSFESFGFSERFDHFICNPPLLPVPHGIAFPLVGNGGEDGLDLTVCLLERANDLLSSSGSGYILGTMLGNSDSPNFERIESLASSHHLSITISVQSGHSLSPAGQSFSAMVETAMLAGETDMKHVHETMLGHFERLNATHLYMVAFKVRKKCNSNVYSLNVLPLFYRNSTPWFI